MSTKTMNHPAPSSIRAERVLNAKRKYIDGGADVEVLDAAATERILADLRTTRVTESRTFAAIDWAAFGERDDGDLVERSLELERVEWDRKNTSDRFE